MVSLHYKGRIHKGKFTARSVRYVLCDQAARLLPGLQRRWLLPVESHPIESVASEDVPLPSAVVGARPPDCFKELGIAHSPPVQLTDHIYSVEDVTVTGWAGAMIKDGHLLTIRPQHNWVSSLRAHPHRLRALPRHRPYFNLMAPFPARGHIFHWLFNSILPLLSYLEKAGSGSSLGLIVNGERSEFQNFTIDFLKQRYMIGDVEPVAKHEAVRVPHLKVAIPVPHRPRALQSPAGLAMLNELGAFIGEKEPPREWPRKIYVSRDDAKLRRVLNEGSLLALLEAKGFKRVVLSRMPLAHQVELFRSAETVVAPHGAGLAHIAWCKEGSSIAEFFPGPGGPKGNARNASSDYWLISAQRGLSYKCYLAGPVETRSDGFSIDQDLLVKAIEDASVTMA
jgi:hypothetical protein